MKLLFEKSKKGKGCKILPPCDVPMAKLPDSLLRKEKAALPCLDENEISRHYSALAKRTFGVNDGFYPLGSCTMKYNPKVNEELAALPGFTDCHPLAPDRAVQGSLAALYELQELIKSLTGMAAASLQPAAGAHGELVGMMMIRAYHASRGDKCRARVIIPDSAHGTNPASAAMAGFETVEVKSKPDGRLDIDAISALLDGSIAGLMLTNPNTLGLFERDIFRVSRMAHEAGALMYCDGANFNAIMERARPGNMGFDVVHLNAHKTFAAPHGMGGPGAGPVAVNERLAPFLPAPIIAFDGNNYYCDYLGRESIGRSRAFNGNFTVLIKTLCYLVAMGGDGLRAASGASVLNANYVRAGLSGAYQTAGEGRCMHEFVVSCQDTAKFGVRALDYAKALIDKNMHPPTMYFPLIVKEALMIEPTETESVETLDAFIAAMLSLRELAERDPKQLTGAPRTTSIGRPDDVKAARNPILRD
jgi:glycine dehydrogenase subunit 2